MINDKSFKGQGGSIYLVISESTSWHIRLYHNYPFSMYFGKTIKFQKIRESVSCNLLGTTLYAYRNKGVGPARPGLVFSF